MTERNCKDCGYKATTTGSKGEPLCDLCFELRLEEWLELTATDCEVAA